MPTDDPRLERALRDAAPPVDGDGVLERVADRRVRRRRNHRLALAALAMAVLLVVGTATVLVTRDDGTSPHVAAPGAQFQARVVAGDASVTDGTGRLVTPKRVTLDAATQLLRPPLLVGATALSVASYAPGPEGDVPSHVVRVDGTHVVDMVNLKARILSIAEGEGARWALTQNRSATGGRLPDVFLKRITGPDEPASEQLPNDADPVGPIAALGGAVWVPVRDGVYQFDVNGKRVRHIPLPDADARWVAQVGKFAAYVTDGDTLRHLDPATGVTNDTISFGPELLGLASADFQGRVLLAAEGGGTENARVARAESGTPVRVTAVLPDGFTPTGLAASTTRIWATGTVDGAPAIALLDDDGVQATVVLENAGGGAALVWTGARTIRAVSGGELYEIALP